MDNLSSVMSLPLRVPKTIPNGWCWKRLTDICKPKQWRTISNSELTAAGYPVFGANGFIGFYPEFNHESETIAVTCRGATCGTINLVPPKTYITGNSMCLDHLVKDISQKYLYYATQFRTLSDVISGSAQPQITIENLKKVTIPIPPLPEQKEIASILTSVDDVIENTQRQIDKLQDLRKATMNELLTKGINHTKFKDSKLGRIPKDWEVTNFSNIFSLQLGKTMNKKDREEGDCHFPYLANKNVQWCRVDTSDISTMNFSESERAKFDLQYGDLLICEGGEAGRSAIWKDEIPNCYFQNAIHRARLRDVKFDPTFFMFTMEFLVRMGRLTKFIGQTSIAHLTKENLEKIFIPVPSASEQKIISNSLNSISDVIQRLSEKKQQTQSLKKSLMQDLLTGKIRVEVN